MNIEKGDGSTAEVFLSVDEDVPLEEGGPSARKGFNYQDEVCVNLFLRMLRDESLEKIHCETHDDHILVWNVGGKKVAEYVQVKSGEADHLWSVASLCKVDQKSGDSLFHKSLKNDRHLEESLFRIITLRDVASPLKPLTFSLGSTGREPQCSEIVALVEDISGRFPGFKSKKQNGAAFWIERCVWEVCPNESDLAKANLYEIIALAHDQGHVILADQARLLLDDLRLIAKNAGAARWKPDKVKKIVTRQWLMSWWDKRIQELLDNAPSAGGKLAEKLEDAGATEDMVASAIYQRRQYAVAVRTSKYMSDDDAELLQSSIRAAMFKLRSEYVAGEFEATPLGFLNLCLGQLRLTAASAPIGTKFPTEEFAYGCMFDIADRCLLRFTSPQP